MASIPPQLGDTYLVECAGLFLKYRKFEKAKEIYSNVLQRNVRNENALKGLGQCFFSIGNWSAATRCFKAYTALSGTLEGKIWEAVSLLKNGELEIARQYCTRNGGIEKMLSEGSALPSPIPGEVLDSLRTLLNME